MAEHVRRVLLRLAPGLRQAIDPGDIFLLEAVDDDTHVRTRRAERLVDVRTLGELEPIFRPAHQPRRAAGFVEGLW